MVNEKIRFMAKGAGIPLWKIADALSISEATMTRLMRKELSLEEKAQIEEIIINLSKRSGQS